uniref:Epstein-Barr virus EBNA-1-like protein n=1 Tax=Oryza sativa subsp. japonica TaxID=39947 RepID=Q6YY37_ORYSJ|nr:Epstein-Barr virus EBNA-1-like protein [Oryza sativa Japonica Group]BAD29337.1 Epstein-Barr virus EBNA-1-like protein [Oryza sativa Japonica Group]
MSEVHAEHARVWEGEARRTRGLQWTRVWRAHTQPHGSRWTARASGTEGSGGPGSALTRSRPRWRRRGGSHAGRREEEDEAGRENGRRAAAEFSGARQDDYGQGGAHRIGERRKRGRANGSDRAGRGQGRRIATAATGGKQKGKFHRSDGSSIQRGGSISGARGIRFRRRMGRRGTEEGQRREAASGSGRQWRRGHAGRQRALGRRLCAFGTATELLCELKEARESEEGEREEALPSRAGSDGRSTARGEFSGLGLGKRKKRGGRSPLRLLAHSGFPAHAMAEGGEDGGSKAAMALQR